MRRSYHEVVSSGGAMPVKDAAAYAGVSEQLIRQAIHSSEGNGEITHLRARKAGSRYLVTRRDLDAWLESLPEA
ncbi:MAG: helix-turn-helix domain-containing protein [Actinomyces urogenitalis]|nr:helix-turn-helix domain-containing protein [Actinomyces urogenitalis]